ncbi:hypothetical protein [Nocardia salmonicida]|uniref:hypothetical protein n=1 Tax=Nocardia salmonicida TaxID=53431 RepID=UPI0033E1AC45
MAISVASSALVVGCTPRPPYPDLTTQEERDNAQRMIIGLSPVEDFDQEMIRELHKLSDVAYSVDPELNLETHPYPRRYDACDSPLHLSIGRSSSDYKMSVRSLLGDRADEAVTENWDKFKVAMRESGSRLGFTEMTEYAPTHDSNQHVISIYNNVQGGVSLAYVPGKELNLSGHTGCRPSRTETAAATPTGVR